MRNLFLEAVGSLGIALVVIFVWIAAPIADAVYAANLSVPKAGQSVWPPTTKLPSAKTLSRVLELGEGSCLRGPLQVLDAKGKVLFALADGVYYPIGCDAKICPPEWNCYPKGTELTPG